MSVVEAVWPLLGVDKWMMIWKECGRSIIQHFPLKTEENQENSRARRCHCRDPNGGTPSRGPVTWHARKACLSPQQPTVLRIHSSACLAVWVAAVMSQHLFMLVKARSGIASGYFVWTVFITNSELRPRFNKTLSFYSKQFWGHSLWLGVPFRFLRP